MKPTIQPSKALVYSNLAEINYTKYMKKITGNDLETTQGYLNQVMLIQAYIQYVNDDLYGARDLMNRYIPNKGYSLGAIALLGTLYFRLSCEYEEDYLVSACGIFIL